MANKSFLDKINAQNFGNSAKYWTIAAIVISFLFKILIVPKIEIYYNNSFFTGLKYWLSFAENFAIVNCLCFFACLILFKNTIGKKLFYAMQIKSKSFENKWISIWLKTVLLCLIIIGITTFVTATLFKSWFNYLLLCIILLLPYYLKNIMKSIFVKKTY